MRNNELYEKADSGERVFPIRIFRIRDCPAGPAFSSHWHEQMEMLYFAGGRAVVGINSRPVEAEAGDLLVINNNELHSGYCAESPLHYYCIIFDSAFVSGGYQGVCERKYFVPLEQNRLRFHSRIRGDARIGECVMEMVRETGGAQAGYELFIKASMYRLLGILFRDYVDRVLTERESERRAVHIQRLDKALEFIDANYAGDISLDELARLCCLSRYRFCHLFKELTGRSPGEHILRTRVAKAELLLQKSDLSITRIAMNTGFGDANYFSRVFRKYRGLSPSALRKS